MAILNTGIPTNLTEYPNSFKRQGAFPLESFSVFYSMTDAEAYASSNPVAYVGQNIVVINGDAVDMYLITSTAGTLKKLASTTASGDLASDVAALQTEIGNARRGKESLQASIEGMAITVDTTATTEGAAKSYKFTQDGKDIITIDIPKDMVVSSGTIETFTEENKPEGVDEAGTYVVLTIANKTNDKLYINVSTLLDDKTVEGSEGDMITITADSSEGPVKLSATIVDGSITEDKLAEEVTNKLALAVSAIQKIETGSTNGTIKVDGVDIAVFGLGDAAYKGVATEVTEGSDALVTSGAVQGEIAKTNKTVSDHVEDLVSHVTADDKENWSDKYTKEETEGKINDAVKVVADDLKEHTEDTVSHVTAEDKTSWADKYTKEEIDGKVSEINTTISDNKEITDGHANNNDIHVTVEDKANWADKYTKEETNKAIADAIAGADHLKRTIVTELPTENIDANTIYMIKKGTSETGDNYEEYMYIDGALVKVGDSTVDLSNYLTKDGDASDTTVAFTTAVEDKPELTSGDKLSVLFGKIKKWLTSLHKVAFTGNYDDLNNRLAEFEATQTTAEGVYQLAIADTEDAVVYSVELFMGYEKVIGDIEVNGKTVTVKFTDVPASDVTVRVLYKIKAKA